MWYIMKLKVDDCNVGKIPINKLVLVTADRLIGVYQLLQADTSGDYLAISPHRKYWYV